MKKVRLSKVLFVLLSVVFASCNREEDVALDRELVKSSTEIDFTTEFDFNAVIDVSSENNALTDRSAQATSSIAPCASVTVDNNEPGIFPKTFTINFGSGCTHNGITRSGSVMITLTDYVMNSGSMTTIVRGDNYYVNGMKVEGTVTYQNTTVSATTPQWNRTITNGKVTHQDGRVFMHNGTRSVKQTEGVNTLVLIDNVYEITSGTHTITKVGGTTLTLSVVEPLIKKYSCTNISQGKLGVQGTVLDGVIDYGDNTCDKLATYTHSNGNVYNIVLL